MTQDRQPPEEPARDYRVNFFRPRPGFMRQQVRFIWIMLAAWGLFAFGFQFLLVFLQRNPVGQGVLTQTTLLGFPFHFWFTGQFLIVWFILLCFLFNLFIDRLNEKYRRRK